MEAALLIGNGLNRCYNGSVPWDVLLENIANAHNVSFDKHNSFPLEFESIINQILKKEPLPSRNIYDNIKDEIASIVKEQKPPINSLHAYYTKNIYVNHILTTNYDYMLENAFCNQSKRKIKNRNCSEIKYSIYRYLNVMGKYFYHIHGEADRPRSLCLGYEHYAGYLAELRRYLKGKLPIGQKIRQNSSYDQSSWTNLFFTHDIYIVGLGLDTCEIDLWWLLTYRAYLYYSNESGLKTTMRNRIKYFSTRKDEHKLNLLKNLHVETETVEVFDNNYEDAYKTIAQIINEDIDARASLKE